MTLSYTIGNISLNVDAIDYCMDSPLDIAYGGQNFNCDFIAQDIARCDVEGVPSHCPKTCNQCIQYGCEDSTMTLSAGTSTATCDLVASNLDFCEYDVVKNSCRATCKACIDSSRFNIRLLNMGTNTDFDEAFIKAQQRWEELITNDLPDEEGGGRDWFRDFGEFNNPIPFNGAVDDVVIAYAIEYIDGLGEIKGYANTVDRRSGNGTPISGIMKFDVDDFLYGPTGEDADIIILHEMGHVLGVVNVFNTCNFLCIFNTRYTCPKAQDAYAQIYPGVTLQLEDGQNEGGQRCYHWEEEMFPKEITGASELMTGKFEANVSQPITIVTLAALDDVFEEYVIDYSKADPYPVGNNRNGYVKVNVPKHTFILDINRTIID